MKRQEDGTTVVVGMGAEDSACVFEGVNGRSTGGRAEVGIIYGTAEPLAKIRFAVNGVDYSFVNALNTGGTHNREGYTGITVTLKPGNENVITLTGGYGEVAIEELQIKYLVD
ncbi:hypothetical protein [Paenibacillus sp. JCM 10914]|uniref:hypothetical protein n=1 Tax=Paenibacillus sp. JCM 10914 TaxID=1236974 RepID=UPI0003CC586C|nr:hypothetical protein [Paenibacillus sp. JCM 10914]GAE05550.1 hypothetical protein JCM10914_1657 [Paenibacillus sp. JCM 10914]